MRTIDIGGGQPLSEGSDTAKFVMDYAERRRLEEGRLREKLARFRTHCVGNFKTHVRCHCPAHVVDHATEHDPDERKSFNDFIVGPGPSLQEQVASFKLYHQYWCDACGLKYEASVIEGRKGWVPHEKRPEFAD